MFQMQLVGEDLLSGVRADAVDLDFAHQPDAVGVDLLERELFGVPAGDELAAAGRDAAASSRTASRSANDCA